MKVTDYERIARVVANQHGQIECPKCGACCMPRPTRNCATLGMCEWDCKRCGRGWCEVPHWVNTVEDAHRAADDAANGE